MNHVMKNLIEIARYRSTAGDNPWRMLWGICINGMNLSTAQERTLLNDICRASV
jgi:hypothetical protein